LCRKTSPRSHAPLRKTRREHHDTIRPGSDRRHHRMVAIAAKVVNLEIRPIIGLRKGDYEFIINPIVDVGFGENGGATLAPAARLARKFGKNLSLGVEYYTGLGPIQDIVPFNEQQHNIYAVADFKIGRWDVNAGIGYGLTGGSDRVMAKLILGTDLNEGVSSKSK
jgi:hypothetical protein